MDQSLIEKFLLWRKRDKLLTTYGDSLTEQVNPVSGRLHANYVIGGAKTGRMSSANPNMQNIPKRGDIPFRDLFQPRESWVFVHCDFDQMELRLASLVAGEETLLRAYSEGRDVHRETAAWLLRKAPKDTSRAERNLGKALNFGLLYGQSARELRDFAAETYSVSMTLDEATAYRRAWFQRYPRIRDW